MGYQVVKVVKKLFFVGHVQCGGLFTYRLERAVWGMFTYCLERAVW